MDLALLNLDEPAERFGLGRAGTSSVSIFVTMLSVSPLSTTQHGVFTTIRASRGQDIYAACGLLSTSKKIGEIREHEDEEKMNK